MHLEVNDLEIIDSPLFGTKRGTKFLSTWDRKEMQAYTADVYDFDQMIVHLLTFEVA